VSPSDPRRDRPADRYVCVDFGSTFTKVVEVASDGRLLATGSARTTVDTDVMDGFDLALEDAGVVVGDAAVLACSSAGGGLRIAVIGYERAITAEAGYRVALSAGGRVCHVTSGELDDQAVAGLVDARPDVLLLVGGTDGGNSEVLLHNARAIGRAGLELPVVLAGNAAADDQVRRILRRRGVPVSVADNVLPRIGVLDPRSARQAIRETFITHVIGGKHLSRRVDLASFVEAATPDAVLAGVELLADGIEDSPGAGDVVVVDVGGATTDVYSVTTPDRDDDPADREAVATLWRSRTVEGDLGVRWNAPSILEAGAREGMLTEAEHDRLKPDAERRRAEPGLVPTDEAGSDVDQLLATVASRVALRRHARPHATGEVRYPGKDLSRVALVVGSGGVLRHCDAQRAEQLVREAVEDPAGGWRHPERARYVVDRDYVLAAAGLIGQRDAETAVALLRGSLGSVLGNSLRNR
jgi:uncharacterized protein (TIGR01319 family)